MISYLQIEELTKSFGDLVLFENLSFGISEGDRIGLIAKNGTGKTTLLNIIAGKEDYDSGNVTFRRDLRVGYLEQMPVYPPELTVIQACFHSQNETVQVISQYEQIMMTIQDWKRSWNIWTGSKPGIMSKEPNRYSPN